MVTVTWTDWVAHGQGGGKISCGDVREVVVGCYSRGGVFESGELITSGLMRPNLFLSFVFVL